MGDEKNLLEQRLDGGSVNLESVRLICKKDYIEFKKNTVIALVVCFTQKYKMFSFVTFEVVNAISCLRPDHRIVNLRVKSSSDLVGSETNKKPNVFF